MPMSGRENILLVRLKSIGDVLFTLPAVYAVRENFPDAHISFLTSKENVPLLQGFTEVNEIVALDRTGFQSRNLSAAFRGLFRLMRHLRNRHFSLAVDFQGYGETALLNWWSGAPERWGSVYRAGRAWAYTRGEWRDNQIHPVEWNLKLLRQCGMNIGIVRNVFILPEDALEEAKQFFASNHLNPAKKTLFLQPFTSSAHKNWPLKNYFVLAQHFYSQGMQIIFGGGPKDRPALEPAQAAGFAVSAGVPLLVTGGLMQLSTFTLGGDTGLLHLAVAMGKRVAMLISSTAPGKPYPFQHAEWAISPPPGKMVSEISADEVIAITERAFESRRWQ